MRLITTSVLLGLTMSLFCSPVYPETEERTVPVFDIHFVVMTQREGIESKTSVQRLKNEVDILNRYFVGENGEHPVKFSYKGQYSIKELNDSACMEFLKLGDSEVDFDWDQWTDRFNSCSDPRVADPTAINFYIYDAYSSKHGFKDRTARGKNNRNRPFIFFDWERLNHKVQSPEEHEMGHVFGLSHVCVEGAKPDTPTNIMASKSCGKGSGGRRDIGFNAEQLSIIRETAQSILERMNSR